MSGRWRRREELPEVRREELAEDLDWALRWEDDGTPYIALNLTLTDEEAREARREAIQAHKREERRCGIFAAPLLAFDSARGHAREHPKETAITAAIAVVGVLTAVALLVPHPPGRRPLARPPAQSSTPKALPSRPPAQPGQPIRVPSATPGHTAVPVTGRPIVSHPGKPRPPKRRRPPTDRPVSPPVTQPLPCARLRVDALGVVQAVVRIDLGVRRLGVLCPRSP